MERKRTVAISNVTVGGFGHSVAPSIEGERRRLISATCCGIEDVLSYFDDALSVSTPPDWPPVAFCLLRDSRRRLFLGLTEFVDPLGQRGQDGQRGCVYSASMLSRTAAQSFGRPAVAPTLPMRCGIGFCAGAVL